MHLWDQNDRARRSGRITLAGGSVPPPKASILKGEKRKHVVSKMMDLMRDWRDSPFENEGPVIAGFRSSLCLEGNPWAASDREAGHVVAEALRLLGAKRPTWAEGQPEYNGEFDYCAWCGGALDEDDRASRRRFCSAECARVYTHHRNGANMEHDGGALLSAYRLVAKEKAAPRPCRYCRTMFKHYRKDAEFCSASCAQRFSRGDRVRQDITCEWCGTATKPSSRGQKFCSITCRTAAHYEAERIRLGAEIGRCANCDASFTPSAKGEIFCSERCRKRHAGRAYWQRKKEESQPLNLTCEACAETVGTSEAGKIRHMAPRTFDFMLVQQGARITGEARLAA
ncbi:hypothetical protein [Consotaella aegiceratis]|uniref:hypothetical protein n=1 Tax=Consotaella aegiceratis TaxID=3097961 RepID=UPI002F40400D